PAFNGTVRLMAIVWSARGVGQAQAEVLVRDPVVLTASLPRFLAPGDKTRMLLEIVHTSGPSGRIGVDVSSDGLTLGSVPSGIELEDQGKVVLSVPVTAGDIGLQEISVALTTPDGRQLTKILTVPVQMNDPELARTSRFSPADGDSLRLDRDVFAGLHAGTGSATISVGPLARFDAPGLLQALDRYPYGCTEQITSGALPLLYFDQVASAMGLATRDQVALRIDQAIAEVLNNQAANGAFGLWRPGSGDFWLDAYVSDFLSRARAQGYAVPENAFRQAMDNLRNTVNYAPDFDRGGESLAYALYVLAREGAAATGDLRYYADVKGDAFATPLAAAQLGAALASYGDQLRADAMFTRAARLMEREVTGDEGFIRIDYGTRLRDAAAVLTLATEAGSNVIDRAAYADRIAPLQGASIRSTQEAMWTLLAANAMIGSPDMQGFSINGAPANGPLVRVLEDDASLAPVSFSNDSGKAADVTLTTFGVPSEPVPGGGNGYAIERLYFTMDGLDVSPDAMKVGQRYVTVLRVIPLGGGEARLIINDPLPAGLEIDNPNLLRGGDVAALDWLKLLNTTENTEFRQDRFLAAVNWRSDQLFQLGYIVRAVSPGVFYHPAASVEDMYRPTFRARTDAGRVTISE
ncbi:MAG: alpha-2-macroglobulin, partial [Halocynthiibacter sp.]